MSLIKKFFIIFFLLLPISNSFGAMHTFVQNAAVTDGTNNDPNTIEEAMVNLKKIF